MTTADLGSLRVLLVDDDADQRFVVRRLFAKAGIDTVVEAADGASGLEAAIEHRPDLVVLDLDMPVRSGIDVLPDLRAAVPDAQIVILSNLPRGGMEAATRARGATGYVEKLTAPGRLVDEILVAAAVVTRAVDHISTKLPSDTTAARSARHLVRSALDDAGRELLETVELLVTELVTNSVLHASSAPSLDLHLRRDVVRIEVYDDDPTVPQPRDPGPDRPGGRGLILLDRLSSRWGVEPQDGGGKVVWFELDRHRDDPVGSARA